MQKDVYYFQTPYKQLRLNELQVVLPPIIGERKQVEEVDKEVKKYLSTMERFVAESNYNSDTQVVKQSENISISIKKPKIKLKNENFEKLKKRREFEYQIFDQIKQGDQIKVTDYFMDQLSSKYAKSARDRTWSLQKYQERRRIQYNNSVNMVQVQDLEIQNFPKLDGVIKKKQKNEAKKQTKLDVVLYLRSNSIHIPAIIGDPLLYEEKKIESFREQSILRDSFKLNIKKNKSKSTSKNNEVYDTISDRNKNNNIGYQSMDIQPTNEHVKIFFKSNKVSVYDPQQSPRSFIISAHKKRYDSVVDHKYDEIKTPEIQKQCIKQTEQYQVSQQDQQQLQENIEEVEFKQAQIENLREQRKKRLLLIQKLKEIERNGESISEVKLLRNELNLSTEDDQLVDKSAIQKYLEQLPKKKEKLSEFQKHYKLLKRLQIKAKTLIQHNENHKNYDVISSLKQFQEQLITRDKKLISTNSILNLQLDFKKILIKADIQGNSTHEPNNRHLQKYSKLQF